MQLSAVRESVRRGITPGERGALIGAAVGFATGAALYSSYADNDNGGRHFSHLVLAGAILAVPGAVLGALIGRAASK